MKRLTGVQALRGVAAVAVVLCHAARHVNKVAGAPVLAGIFQAGHAGVDLFFVISGFIILFVHRPDIGTPGRLPHYLGRRFNRVMPLYWFALAITIGMTEAGGHWAPTMRQVLWSASLLPTANEPLLGLAWTLQYEVVFYAAFALLILNRVAGVAVLGAWLLFILVTALGLAKPALPPQFCGSYGLEFFMGMTAAGLVQMQRIHAAKAVALLGMSVFGLSLILESIGWLNGFGTAARIAYGSGAVLLVAGVAGAERHGQLSLPAWLQVAGEASYSIYLFQFVFIGLVWQAWLRLGLARHDTGTLCFVALAVFAVAGGILVSRLIEHPLLRLTRGQHRVRALS